MGAGKRLGLDISAGDVVYSGFAQTDWTIAHNDLKATAETSAVLLRPGSYSNANVFPVRVPANAVRVLVRARYATGISDISTAPVVALYGAYGPDTAFTESTGVFDDTGLIRWARLDTSQSGATVGAVTISTAPSTDTRDGTYKYGSFVGDRSGSDIQWPCGFDTRGAKWVMALVSTAGVINPSGGGSGAIQLEIAFLSYQPMVYVALA
jgi:hypothetical protein